MSVKARQDPVPAMRGPEIVKQERASDLRTGSLVTDRTACRDPASTTSCLLSRVVARLHNPDERLHKAAPRVPGPRLTRSQGRKERVVICAKDKGESKAEFADSLQKAIDRLQSESDMSSESKADIIAKLKARIAELRAGK